MALNATIYKYRIALSDLNRNYYDTLQLTVAQHPSESLERMTARVLAYCINASPGLEFTKGLSTPETPDIWERSLAEEVILWIELGEPSADKLKKATRAAKEVKVYSFNSKSDVWWRQEQKNISNLKVTVTQLPWNAIVILAAMVQRTMDISVTISGDSAFIAMEQGEYDIAWTTMQ